MDLKSWSRQPQKAEFPKHSGKRWCAFELAKAPDCKAIANISHQQTNAGTKGAWGLPILQIAKWAGRLLMVKRGRDRLLKLSSHPPCSSRVCPNHAVSWGYWAGWRSTHFAPTAAQLAQPSPLAISEAMGRHKRLPTTRNIKYCWSQRVLVRVGSHDNSTEASERALDKGLSSCHPCFKGRDYKRDCSYCQLSLLQWLLSFTLISRSCYFRG